MIPGSNCCWSDFLQEIEPSVGESLVKLWERIPAYVVRSSPQGNKLANKNFSQGQGHNNNNQGQGQDQKSGPQSEMGRHPGKGFGGQHWGSGSSQGHESKSQGQGQWGSHGGHGGYSSSNPAHTQSASTQAVSVPQMSPHVNSPFNPLCMPPGMPQGQMFSQSMSPGQNMSPVMILQRGQGHNHRANQGGQGHSQGGGFSGQGGNFFPHGKGQKQ